MRVDNTKFGVISDQKEFIDLTVCERCGNSVQAMKSFLSFQEAVSLSRKKNPLMILQSQIRKLKIAIQESTATLKVFIDKFEKQGGANKKEYQQAKFSKETGDELFKTLSTILKQLVKNNVTSPGGKEVLSNMKLSLKNFLEKALPLFRALSDSFDKIKIVQETKKITKPVENVPVQPIGTLLHNLLHLLAFNTFFERHYCEHHSGGSCILSHGGRGDKDFRE